MTKKSYYLSATNASMFIGFGGMTTPDQADDKFPSSLVNFRLRKDYSLEKRCGARCLFDFGEEIRGVWSGTLHSRFATYFLAGTRVIRSDLNAESGYTEIGRVASSEGNANFFCLQGQLYLTDGGSGVYRIDEDTITPARGYVPLLGKNWDNDRMGEINEPLNLINRHARITYVVSSSNSIFVRVPAPLASVEAFYRNGELVSPNDYEIDNHICALEIFGLTQGDKLELFVTFEQGADNGELLPRFCASTDSVFFCAGPQSRTFFYGGDRSGTMFCTAYVTPEAMQESRRYYNADPLYLPEGYEFQVGDGTSPVRGAIRHHDSLLIFTEKDTWIADANSTGLAPLPARPVNAELGCVSMRGCALSPNDPVSVSRYGLYRWVKGDLEASMHNAVRLPSPIDQSLTYDELGQSVLYYNALDEELWWSFPNRKEVYITAPVDGQWFCFRGISAERLFDADGSVGFIQGSCVFRMDETLSYDLDRNGLASKITAIYESAPLDFRRLTPKNLSAIHLICELSNASLLAELLIDGTPSVSRTIEVRSGDLESEGYTTITRRMRSPRFRSAKFRLTSDAISPAVLHALMLVVR